VKPPGGASGPADWLLLDDANATKVRPADVVLIVDPGPGSCAPHDTNMNETCHKAVLKPSHQVEHYTLAPRLLC
jgi:hypothetical protein